MDWNKLSLIRRPTPTSTKHSVGEKSPKLRKSPTKMKSMFHILNKHQSDRNDDPAVVKRSVTDSVMRQIILGESVLEMGKLFLYIQECLSSLSLNIIRNVHSISRHRHKYRF